MSTLERVIAAQEAALEAQHLARTALEQAVAERARWVYGCMNPIRFPNVFMNGLGFEGPPYHGLVADSEGCPIVPAMAGKRIVNLVRVLRDGSEQSLEGASLNGTSFELPRRGSAVTVVVETYQDALVCFRAVPGARVVLAWGAQNARRIASRALGLVTVTSEGWAPFWRQRVAEVASRHRTRVQAGLAVDGEIRDAVMRAARWNPMLASGND